MKTLLTIGQPARIEDVEGLVKSVADCARAQGFKGIRLKEIELITEEAVVNICNYAYPGREGDLEIRCRREGRRFLIEIVDAGVPFDLTSLPDPDTKAAMEERKVGGLGVFLIKRLADAVAYRRENDRNILTLAINRRK